VISLGTDLGVFFFANNAGLLHRNKSSVDMTDMPQATEYYHISKKLRILGERDAIYIKEGI
jgi:hypothetical protein